MNFIWLWKITFTEQRTYIRMKCRLWAERNIKEKYGNEILSNKYVRSQMNELYHSKYSADIFPSFLLNNKQSNKAELKLNCFVFIQRIIFRFIVYEYKLEMNIMHIHCLFWTWSSDWIFGENTLWERISFWGPRFAD